MHAYTSIISFSFGSPYSHIHAFVFSLIPNATVRQIWLCVCVVRAMNRTGQTAVAHFNHAMQKGTTINKISTLFIVERMLAPTVHYTPRAKPWIFSRKKNCTTEKPASTCMQVTKRTQKELNWIQKKEIAYLFACSTCILQWCSEYLARRCLFYQIFHFK